MASSPQKPFSITMPMFWGDMDAQGHLNNVQYFRYCEQARAEWLRHLGVPLLPNDKLVLLVVTASCTYLRPIHYPSDVTISMTIDEIGRSSMMLSYDFFIGKDFNTSYAKAQSKIVCFDPIEQKSVPVPELFREYAAGRNKK